MGFVVGKALCLCAVARARASVRRGGVGCWRGVKIVFFINRFYSLLSGRCINNIHLSAAALNIYGEFIYTLSFRSSFYDAANDQCNLLTNQYFFFINIRVHTYTPDWIKRRLGDHECTLSARRLQSNSCHPWSIEKESRKKRDRDKQR